MAATMQESRTKVTDLSFADTDEEITRFLRTNQELLLLWPVNTKHGRSPRQHESQVGIQNRNAARLAIPGGSLLGKR